MRTGRNTTPAPKPVVVTAAPPITEDLLEKLGMDSWPDTVFILTSADNRHATELLSVKAGGREIYDRPLRGLACFETKKLAEAEAATDAWEKYNLHPEEVSFEAAFNIAKDQPRLNCMVLHRNGRKPILFNL